jgi:hypothetical protein
MAALPKTEERTLAWALGRYDAAIALVGQLRRGRRQVFYINQQTRAGQPNGRTVEFSCEFAAIEYLFRNRYV